MITQESVRRAMTRQQAAVERLKTAYKLNNIPVPSRDERALGRLSSPRLESLADHWEQRFAESRAEDGDADDEESPRRVTGMPPGLPRFPNGEINLLHPSCPISVIQKVLRRMSGLHGPSRDDRIMTEHKQYHGPSNPAD